MAVFLLLAMMTPASAQYMNRGAGIGALLGLALGDDLGDVARGAALGAAAGGIANVTTQGKRNRQREAAYLRQADQQRSAERERLMAERERQLMEQERRYAEMKISQRERELLQRERQMAEQERLRIAAMTQVRQVADERLQAVDAIVAAIGPDVWEGYKALRACNWSRAHAMANVAATSRDPNHVLASKWLRAMTAVDEGDTSHAGLAFEQLISSDPEIDTAQQASIAADRAVLDMRGERFDIGIPPCR